MLINHPESFYHFNHNQRFIKDGSLVYDCEVYINQNIVIMYFKNYLVLKVFDRIVENYNIEQPWLVEYCQFSLEYTKQFHKTIQDYIIQRKNEWIQNS